MKTFRLLDAWRGIAALWVVTLHACIAVIVNLFPSFEQNPICLIGLWGQLGVPMFFIISGYCISNAAFRTSSKPSPVTGFLLARIWRIYPPYLGTVMLTVCLSVIATSLAGHGLIQNSGLSKLHFFSKEPLYYLANITLTQLPLKQDMVLDVFWTLCYEVAFYWIVAIFMMVAIRITGMRWLLLVLNSLTVATLIWVIISPISCPFPLNLWHQFGLGIAVWGVLNTRERNGARVSLLIIVGLCIIFGAIHNRGKGGLGDVSSRIQTFFCLGFAVLLIIQSRWDSYLSKLTWMRPLLWLGSFSYSLYLTHLLSLALISQAARRLNVTLNWYGLIVTFQIIFATASGWCFYRLFERPFIVRREAKPDIERK